MKRYIRFDTERFLKDSKKWDESLEELKQDLASITEIGGVGEGIPSKGGISSPTERTVIDRDKVQRRIDEIEERKDCFKFAWDCIGEKDKELLIGFYYSSGFVYNFVDRWCEDNTSNRDYCYKAKRKAEEKFGKACARWMEINGYDV